MGEEWQKGDREILDEEELEVRAGRIKVRLRQLSIAEFYRFVPGWRSLLSKYLDLLVRCEVDLKRLDQVKTKADAEGLAHSVQSLLSFREFRRDYIRLLRRAGIVPCSVRRFEREATPADLAKILVYVYLFNTDGVKKKLTSLLQRAGFRSATTSETSSTSSTGGGGYRQELRPRFRRPRTSRG